MTTFVGLPPVREAVTIAEVGEVAIINPTFLQTDDPVFELDDFVVSGMVTGQAKAIAQQRAADNLTNVVASDAFGQFSDRNPAEALKRLPGVSIAEDQGEGRFIRIRGAGASLNSVSLDGVFAATPEENGRSTALNIISIDQLESIEVTKTWLPAQRANFIGDSVNLVTRSALDRDGRFASLESAWGQHEIAEDPSYRLNAVYGDSFQRGEHLLGFQLSVDFSEDNRGSDTLSIRQYDPQAGFEIGSSESDQIPEGLLFAGHSLEDYVITRERTGFSTKLEYRCGAHHEWSLAYSYNQFDDDEVRQTTSFSQDFGNFAGTRFLTASLAETLGLDLNDPVVQTRISRGNDRLRFSELQILGEMDFDPARGLYTKQTFNSTSNKSWRNTVTEDRVDTAQLNGLHTWDALDIAYKLYQSEADKTWTERRLSLGTPARASFVEIIDGLPQITVNDDAFSDPAIYLLNEQRGSVANNNFASIDERVGASLDLTARYEEGGWRFQTKAGIAHDEIDKVFTRDFQSFSEIESGAPNLELSLTDFDLDGGMLNDFLREEDGFDFGPQINTAAADDLLNFQDGPVTFAQTLNNITNGVTDAILRNYEASEAVTGFYVQQTMDWEAWRFIFGARFERTENTFTNNLVDPRSELLPTTVRFASPNFWAVLIDRVGPEAFITETTSGRDYNHLLPALHVIRRWDRLTLRAAYTQTIVRPQFDHLIPREIPSIDGARFGTSIQLPNFELEAQESENFDLSLDYEMEGISGVGLALFHKELDKVIFQESRLIESGQAGAQELANKFTSDQRDIVDWSTTRQANSGPGSLTGVEVYFDSDLPFLPEAFHGLHLHGNFTVFDSEVTLLLRERAGESVPLFSQPDWVGNVSVSYERKGFLARVSANYQGRRLANVASGDSLIEELESRTGSRTGLDLYEEGRFRLDLFFQYTWRDSLTLFAEVTNVTNEPVERTYGEDGYLTASLQYTEPVYFIGLQWKL